MQEIDKMSQTKMKDFLAILLTAKDDGGVGMTPLEIRNEVDTFLFEGWLYSCLYLDKKKKQQKKRVNQ